MSRRKALSRSLAGLVTLIRAGDRYRAAAADHYGLTGTDSRALSVLDSNGPIPQERLARLLGMTRGAATGVVDRLERDGTARRTVDPHDRRRNLVELTDVGHGLLEDSRTGLSRALDDLDPTQREVLAEALPPLAEAVIREADQLGELSTFQRPAERVPQDQP